MSDTLTGFVLHNMPQARPKNMGELADAYLAESCRISNDRQQVVEAYHDELESIGNKYTDKISQIDNEIALFRKERAALVNKREHALDFANITRQRAEAELEDRRLMLRQWYDTQRSRIESEQK